VKKWILGAVGLVALIALGWIGSVQLVWSELPGVLRPPLDPIRPINSLSADRCGACHVQIRAEWAQSHHGQSAYDPLYLEDLAAQGSPYFCNHCHAPLVEQQPKLTVGLWSVIPELVPRQIPNPRYDEALHQEGVTCVACHQVGDTLEGPHEVTGAPHPTKKTDRLGSEQLCEPCHSLALTKIGRLERPLMETVDEWRVYRSLGGDKTCIECHMPAVNRPSASGAPVREGRSHRLLGPFDKELLAIGIVVESATITFAPDETKAELVLFNGTGHNLPTAEPHRTLRIRLEAGGKTDEARIARPIDLEAIAEEPGADTTLKPKEKRTIRLRLPVVAPARLAVDFLLWDPDKPGLLHNVHTFTRTP
jgi:hypothetical protein